MGRVEPIQGKKCACSGIRACLFCQSELYGRFPRVEKTYIYCSKCKNKAFLEEIFNEHICGTQENSSDRNQYLEIDGICLETDIITSEEEEKLIEQIDSFEWVDSQSGRRKQDFGPKINFKQKKIKFDQFVGLPELDINILNSIRSQRLKEFEKADKLFPKMKYCQSISDRTILNNFFPVEVCHLEYCPERGSNLDPHFDDSWIWGERLVNLNLLSQTTMTLTLPECTEHCIRIPMPRRSLLVLYGDARHRYQHGIKITDIESRRISVTYRELSTLFFIQSGDFRMVFNKYLSKCTNLIKP